MFVFGNCISNGNRTEWSPIRSVIITSDKQNWLSAERESNLCLRVMITYRIGRQEFLLQIYYKKYRSRPLSNYASVPSNCEN